MSSLRLTRRSRRGGRVHVDVAVRVHVRVVGMHGRDAVLGAGRVAVAGDELDAAVLAAAGLVAPLSPPTSALCCWRDSPSSPLPPRRVTPTSALNGRAATFAPRCTAVIRGM